MIVWKMKRGIDKPELIAKCVCMNEAQMHDGFFSAIDLIVKASVFKGIPCQRNCRQLLNEKIIVSFSLKFPDQKNLEDYTSLIETLSQTNSLK